MNLTIEEFVNIYTDVYVADFISVVFVVSSWLLSRDSADYTPEIQEKIREVLERNQINSEKYLKVNQKSCPASTFNLFQ